MCTFQAWEWIEHSLTAVLATRSSQTASLPWPFPFYRVKGNLTGNLFYSQELLILADLEGRYLTLTYYSLAMPRKTHIVSSFRV